MSHLTKLLLKIFLKIKILKYFNLKLNVQGQRIPIINGIGYNHLFNKGDWMDNVFIKLIPVIGKDPILFDVGVNIGQSLLKIKKSFPGSEYYGFEPNADCLFYVEQLIKLNHFQKVTIFPFALSLENGLTTLNYFQDSNTDSSASIVEGFRTNILNKKIVSVGTLEYAKKLIKNNPTVIKIDVEGAELEVMKALEDIIIKISPIIICEVLPCYRMDNERYTRQVELQEFLKKANYSIFRIIKTNSDHVDYILAVDDFGVHENVNWSDYLFIPFLILPNIKGLFEVKYS